MTDSQLVKRKLTHTHWDLKKKYKCREKSVGKNRKMKKKKSPTFSTFLLTVFLLPILHVQCVFNYSSIFEICQLCQTFWNLQKFALKFAVSEICEFDQKLFIVVQTDFKKTQQLPSNFQLKFAKISKTCQTYTFAFQKMPT
jgi:nitrate reductase NapE component